MLPRVLPRLAAVAALAIAMTGCAVVPGHGRGQVYGSVGTTVYSQGPAPVYGQVYGQAPAPVYAPAYPAAYPPGYGYGQPVMVGSPHVAVAAPLVIRPWGIGLGMGWGRQGYGHHRY
jgi:hypothetical protein